MKEFVNTLEIEFSRNAIPEIARGQEEYMRNQFSYFGIKTPIRRDIQKPFFAKEYLPHKNKLEEIIKLLWLKPQREYQYFSQELTQKFKMQFHVDDINLFEFMILHKSWWDTIDFIAPKLVGEYFKTYPKQREIFVDKWLDSNNIWLQRSCIIFQLHYKKELDTTFLEYVIKRLVGSNEFFINKAIGWMLRQYGKTNPQWVIDFVARVKLDKLSEREALRLLV